MKESTRTVIFGAVLIALALVLVIRRGHGQQAADTAAPLLVRPPVYDEMGMGPGGTHATAPVAPVVSAAGVSGGPSSGTATLSTAANPHVNIFNRPGEVRKASPWGPTNPGRPAGWPTGVGLK